MPPDCIDDELRCLLKVKLALSAIAISAMAVFVIQQHTADSAAVVVESTQASLPTEQTKAAETAPAGVSPIVAVEQTLKRVAASDQVVTEKLQAVLDDNTTTDLTVELQGLAAAFPELKDSIDSYIRDSAMQSDKVAQYKLKVQQRNQQAATDGALSDITDSELDYEKQQLLAEAKMLGNKAVELNRAIRLAAYGHKAQL